MKENEVHTIVGSNVKLTGTLKDTNDIVIHGTVEGEVISDQNIVVDETANVKGPVTAQSVSVSGVVEGMVKALDKLEIHPSGRVDGNIQTKDLIIHSGARFIGKSDIISDDQSQGTSEEGTPDVEQSDEAEEAGESEDEEVKVEVDEE
ncbi:MAG TPA: polymer-forming cytoskeletal protein [Patescibacteria group bacterium]|nr:polymer-forming cytoskeletal protein [Patescibacteria group bacterium]